MLSQIRGESRARLDGAFFDTLQSTQAAAQALTEAEDSTRPLRERLKALEGECEELQSKRQDLERDLKLVESGYTAAAQQTRAVNAKGCRFGA